MIVESDNTLEIEISSETKESIPEIMASVDRGPQGPPGEKGEDGIGISNISQNEDSSLTIKLSDGRSITTMPLKGMDGANGKDGEQGPQGIPGPKGDPGLKGNPGTIIKIVNW